MKSETLATPASIPGSVSCLCRTLHISDGSNMARHLPDTSEGDSLMVFTTHAL